MSTLNPRRHLRLVDEREQVGTGPWRGAPAAALVIAVLGAVAVTVSPITPWTLGVAACGTAAAAAGFVILIVGLARDRW